VFTPVLWLQSGSLRILNNIFYQVLDVDAAESEPNVEGNYNLFYFEGIQPDPPFVQDPQLVDVNHGDLRLKAASPARDIGMPNLVADDITGVLRPQGAGYDLGAYEYVSVQQTLAVDDAYSTPVGKTLTVSAPGVLGNDQRQGGSFSVRLGTDVTYGVLALHADGSFVYTPNNGFSGVDSFTYDMQSMSMSDAHDGAEESQRATVTIHVGNNVQSQHVVYVPLVIR